MCNFFRPATKKILYSIVLLLTALIVSVADYAQVNFSMSTLNGASLEYSSTLQFGPDGRLYVSNTAGQFRVFTISKTGSNNYTVTNTEIINAVLEIPNHNDDLTPYTYYTARQVTGFVVTGTSTNPVIYVSSSDPRIGGGGEAGDVNLDTNSGMISRLTWNGSAWERVDLVRGLPRSEENHATNGLQLDAATNTLYLAVGGNTNAGGPSSNFAYINEYALSAAILKIDLNVINSLPVRGSAPNKYVYDIPTLNDPSRTDIVNPDYNPSLVGSPQTIDQGDPFGGHDGLNMAKLVPGGPVQIHSAGYRNAYDIVITKTPGREGRMYTIDNGANGGWGGYPKNVNTPNVTNEYMIGEPGSTSSYQGIAMVNNIDNLHLVSKPGMAPIYGGHPNPIRANPAGAGLSWKDDATGVANFSLNPTSDWPPVPLSMADPVEANFLMPGVNDNALTTWTASTNGITEYRSPSFFNGDLVGDLFAVDFIGTLWRIKLNAEGTQVVSKEVFATGFSPTPLDVTTQGAGEIFDGTIWVCDYTSNQIFVFTPEGESTIVCTGENTSYTLDDDNDGFSNADETDNGTNPCNALSFPSDFDGDKISDKNDTDDDNDGIPDITDVFHRDATNGMNTASTILYPFLNGNPGTGLFGLGFTGLMSNGVTDPDLSYNPQDPGLIMGGAVGLASFPANEGSAAINNQKNGFQFGYKIPSATTKFNIESSLIGPYFNSLPVSVLSSSFRQGIYIGTGTQADYVMVGISGADGGGTPGLRIMRETNNTVDLNTLYPVANILSASNIYLHMQVDPAAGTITIKYSTNQNTTPVVLGSPISVSGPLLAKFTGAQAIAVGLIAQSGDVDTYAAQYDYMNIVPEGVVPTAIRINAGGPAFTYSGENWSADQYSTGGSTYDDNAQIANTDNDQLYQSERFGEMSYAIPVNSGNYTVRLHFAEIFYTTPGSRVFNVNVENGQGLLNNFDIVADAGGGFTATVKQLANINVTDGFLNINFTNVIDNAKLSGIEILSTGAATNHAPVLVNPISDQRFSLGTTSAVIGLANVFTDDGGIANLVYSVTQNSNPSLVTSSVISGSQLNLALQSGLVDSALITIRATDVQGLFTEDQFKIVITNTPPPAVSLHINSGGSGYSFEGTTWSADQYFTGGSTYADNPPIANTTNDALHHDERYGNFSYAVPLPNGNYTVKLHFAEIFYTTPGSRVFNVNVENGQGLLTNYDILADAGAGNTAVVKQFNVAVADGVLNISFINVQDNAKISGLEIISSSGSLPNTAPVVIAPITDQQLASGTTSVDINLNNVFNDDGGAANLVLTVSGNTKPALVTSATITNGQLHLTLASGMIDSSKIKIKATDTAGLFIEDEFLVNVYSGTTPPLHLRINAGGPTYTYEGITWNADQYFTGGSTYSDNTPIAGTTNDQLYQSERYGNITYAIPVPVGGYTVKLHFAEIFYTVPGARIFNVNVENGQGVLNNYDIVAADAGNGFTAHVEEFTNVNVNDGFLNISLINVQDNAKISGIEVIATGGSGNAAPTVISPITDKQYVLGTTSAAVSLAGVFNDDGGVANLIYTLTSNSNPALVSSVNISGTNANLTLASNITGSALIKIKAADAAGLFVEDEFMVTVAEQVATHIRIASGGAGHTFNGEVWSADQYFTGGNAYGESIAIANTTNDVLYQNERWGNVVYNIPVPAGAYTVKLHFAEIYWTTPGNRIFNVNVENGQGTLSNYDIVAQAGAGATAVVQQFNGVNVSDGFVTITLTSVSDNAKISGIEIISANNLRKINSGLDVRTTEYQVDLNWNTSITEGKVEIERSADGKNFETIHSVTVHAKANKTSEGRIADMYPLAGTSWYRLKTVSTSGAVVNYSEAKKVVFSKAIQSFMVYPNPSRGLLFIELAKQAGEPDNVKIRIINMQGAVVYQQAQPDRRGLLLKVSLPSGLSNGTYIIEVEKNGKKYPSRFILSR